MSRKQPIQGIPGNSFWESQMGTLGWFSLADENSQSWYVGHGGNDIQFPQNILMYTPARHDCEINSENIVHVTEMRFLKKIIPKQVLNVIKFSLGCRKWGCNKWGFKGCLAALPGNRPKSAFSALFLPFSPFSGGPEEHLENPENGGKRPFSSDIFGFP